MHTSPSLLCPRTVLLASLGTNSSACHLTYLKVGFQTFSVLIFYPLRLISLRFQPNCKTICPLMDPVCFSAFYILKCLCSWSLEFRPGLFCHSHVISLAFSLQPLPMALPIVSPTFLPVTFFLFLSPLLEGELQMQSWIKLGIKQTRVGSLLCCLLTSGTRTLETSRPSSIKLWEPEWGGVEAWPSGTGGAILYVWGEGSCCLCSLCSDSWLRQQQVWASPGGGTDSFSSHTGFAGDSWKGGGLPGEAQAVPIKPQLMGLPG